MRRPFGNSRREHTPVSDSVDMLPNSDQIRPVVLVGFAEAASAPEVVWSLVDDGFDVVAFAREGRDSALRHSRHVECREICAPEKNTARAIADLAAILSTMRTGADHRILFPLDDTAVWLCSQIPLPEGWVLAGPSGAVAELALNKQLQTEAAEAAGLNVPRTTLARTVRDVRESVVTFPVILKAARCVNPIDGRLQGCRKWICATPDELDRACAQWGERVPLLVQPFIAGTGEGVFGLATPEGVRAWSAHRRLRMMNPQGSGSSACVSQAIPANLEGPVETLLRRAKWRGLFMIELLRDDSGRVWFVELNGRPWGSMALSRRQGLEYPAWHVRLALDSTSNVGMSGHESPGLVCRHIGREFMHLLFVARGPRSKALSRWPTLWEAIRGVLGIRRGDALYNWRREDPKVFLSDFYLTVHDNLFKARR